MPIFDCMYDLAITFIQREYIRICLKKEKFVLEISRKLMRMNKIKNKNMDTPESAFFFATATASYSSMDNEYRLQKRIEREKSKRTFETAEQKEQIGKAKRDNVSCHFTSISYYHVNKNITCYAIE